MKGKAFFIGATLATTVPVNPGELTIEQEKALIVTAYNEHIETHPHSETEQEKISENQVRIYGFVGGMAIITLHDGRNVYFPFDGFNQG